MVHSHSAPNGKDQISGNIFNSDVCKSVVAFTRMYLLISNKRSVKAKQSNLFYFRVEISSKTNKFLSSNVNLVFIGWLGLFEIVCLVKSVRNEFLMMVLIRICKYDKI